MVLTHLRALGRPVQDLPNAHWAMSFDPEIVVMESTGIFWKNPYATLKRVDIDGLWTLTAGWSTSARSRLYQDAKLM